MERYDTTPLRRALEDLVDSHSLRIVVDALAAICAEKADHIRENWQDRATASVWDAAAKRLDHAQERVSAL